MRIVHLSDIHVAESHFLPELAEKVIAKINELEPEIMVLTGDITDGGYSPEFEQAKHYIDRIECEVKVIVPGNHDARNVGYLCFEDVFGTRMAVKRYRGVTIVGVDSSQPDVDEGHVGRDKYEWIMKSFGNASVKIFALHHHLIPVPNTGRERNILVDAGDVLDLLLKSGVNIALCGHKHVPWVWNLNGMLIVNAGTACSNRVKWGIPPSFNLIELNEGDTGIQIYRIYSEGGQELVLNQPEI